MMGDFPIKDIPIGKPRRCPNCETQAVEIERLRDALKIARDALGRIEAATRNEVRAGDKGYVSRYGINGIALAALDQSK
jgi:hypothetical protein